MIIGEETETIEFKKTTGEKKEGLESICAILNKHGRGTLYFGISDNGYVCGQDVSDNTKKDISRWIYDSIYPRITPTIEIISLDGRKVIKVSFSGKNRPYSINGEYLIRIGTENRRMSTEELKRLIQHSDYSSKWEEEVTFENLNSIDDNSLCDFYESAVNCGRLEMKEYDKNKLLTMLNLYHDGHLNNAAIALFGKNVKIGLKLATYVTNNKVNFSDLKLINGNIYNLVTIAMNYIQERINWKIEINDRKRNEIPEIPIKAIREIVVNAFAHTDYEVGGDIEIGVHPGMIEIYNPGCFPESLTPFDFIDNNLPSYVRNKIILDVLFRSKDVEKSGTGFQRVNEICNDYKVQWEFKKETYGFQFIFIRKKDVDKIYDEELTKTEKQVFDIIDENLRISKEEISLKINKSEKTVQRLISSLITKGFVYRVGSNKNGYWKTKK